MERGPNPFATGSVWRLTTWSGEAIVDLVRTGSTRGFYGTELDCYRTAAPVLGYYWHGRGLGAGMVIKLHRGKRG